MYKQKLYLEALGVTLSISLILLTVFNGESLELYVIIYAMVYTALTALFRPRRRWLDIPGIALFIAFCYIVSIKFLEILFRSI